MPALTSVIRDERGGVMALVAVTLPVLLLFVMLVVDVGNWFEHRRHLQLQADAAVLAGAGVFNRCFIDAASGNAAIRAEALKYSGADPASFNIQVGNGNTGTVTLRLNRRTFERGGFVEPTDDPIYPEPEPCAARTLDAKITEADLPLFFAVLGKTFAGVFESLSAINANARVQAQVLTTLVGGSLPLAIPNPNPRRLSVTFVNESGGADPCAAPPCTVELSGPMIADGDDYAQWQSDDTYTLSVPEGADIGVRVNLGGGVSTTCGEDLVICYDADSSDGLALIRGYSTAGSGAQPGAPVLRGAWPTTSCLSGGFFYGACGGAVAATVDFGTGAGDPTLAPAAGGVLATMSATVDGDDAPMTWSGGVWSTSPSAFSLPAQAGPLPVELSWEVHAGTINGNTCSSGGGNRCKGTFGDVQRFFSGTFDRSGSIRAISLFEPTSTADGSPYTLAAGDHDLRIIVGTAYLRTAEPGDPASDETVVLRVASDSASESQAIDCDAGKNFRDEIAEGCSTPYQINHNIPGCPETTPPVPADCAPTDAASGDKIGQLRQGMNARFASCPPNTWPDVGSADPRAIPLIITDFGAFALPSTHEVAVRHFASFYVTGWDGGTCADNEPYPFTGSSKGNIWGHFIKHVHSNTAGGGDPNSLCNFDDTNVIDTCIAVLTR